MADAIVFGRAGLQFFDIVQHLSDQSEEEFTGAFPNPFLLQLPSARTASQQYEKKKVTQRLEETWQEDEIDVDGTVNLTLPELLGRKKEQDERLVYYLPFKGDKELTVGRLNKCDVQIRETTVSSKHATIKPIEGGWSVSDLGSSNGTFVDGERLAPNTACPVANGQNLWFSSYKTILVLPRDLYDLASRYADR